MSKELDREVAEKVMGWKYDPDSGMAGTKTLHRVPSTEMADVRLWRPSTDPAAAWTVVEAMTNQGRKVTIETCYAGGNMHNDVVISGTVKDLKSVGEADCLTMPEAVCRAALAALSRIDR